VKWGGVVSFFASEHAMRAERVLQRADIPARLVPGPREVSPNCGVAVAFVWDDEPRVAQALAEKKIRFEAIHPYELDDDSGSNGTVRHDAAANTNTPTTSELGEGAT
jgi:hypothetical protein